mgnify:CR=1 FL=1
MTLRTVARSLSKGRAWRRSRRASRVASAAKGRHSFATCYFPPPQDAIASGSARWENTEPTDLGWDLEPVHAYLRSQAAGRPSTFFLLADGKLVDAVGFNGADPWETRTETYSCQKSVAAILVGAAALRGALSLDSSVTLPGGVGGDGDRRRITLRHAMAMTMGLERFKVLESPGERWRYGRYTVRRRERRREGGKGMEGEGGEGISCRTASQSHIPTSRALPTDTDAAMLSVCAALENGLGKPLDEVARDLLFARIGIDAAGGARWKVRAADTTEDDARMGGGSRALRGEREREGGRGGGRGGGPMSN